MQADFQVTLIKIILKLQDLKIKTPEDLLKQAEDLLIENASSLRKKDLKSFRSSISDDDIMGYVELKDTYKKLAKFLKVNVKQLLISAGSDLAIKTVFETFITNKDSIIVQSPSYSMTQVYAKMFGAKIKYFGKIFLKKSFT